MTKSELIKTSANVSAMSRLWSGTKNLGPSIVNNYRKIPGVVRYPLSVGATAAFPIMSYNMGKNEMQEHIANKAYNDAMGMTGARISQEWEKTPGWKRQIAAAIGMNNSLALKEGLKGFGKGPAMYETISDTGQISYT